MQIADALHKYNYLLLELTFGDDKDVIEAGIERWGFNKNKRKSLTPIQENEIKQFIAMTMEPQFQVRNTSSIFKFSKVYFIFSILYLVKYWLPLLTLPSVKCDIFNQLYFQKSIFKIAESVLNNKDFKDTMREVLKEMSIKVEDKRGNGKLIVHFIQLNQTKYKCFLLISSQK